MFSNNNSPDDTSGLQKDKLPLVDKNLISWIEYPKDNQRLEEYMQFLSSRLLVIEKEKYKLELERQSILQTLWGNNSLLSYLNDNQTNLNTVNSAKIPDKSDLIPLNPRKKHNVINNESLNEIIEISTPKRYEDNQFDEMDFSKLDLESLNLILSHFGIKNITSNEFNQGVELLVRIRNYLLDNINIKSEDSPNGVKNEIKKLIHSI